jgi:hypothetical protein
MRDFINRLSNRIMIPLLRSPLHFLVSDKIMLITFTGRKSGQVYTLPVEYRQEGNNLFVFTQKDRTWWKNFEGGAIVSLQLRGHEVKAKANVARVGEIVIHHQMHKMHPRMSDDKVSELAPNLVLVEIGV